MAGVWREAVRERLGRCRMVAVSTTYTVRQGTILRLLRLRGRGAARSRSSSAARASPPGGSSYDRIEELYERLSDADALFFGEVEGTFAELVRRMIARRSLAGVPGAVSLGPEERGGDPRPVGGRRSTRSPCPTGACCAITTSTTGPSSATARPRSRPSRRGEAAPSAASSARTRSTRGFRRKSPERVIAELAGSDRAGFATASFCGAEFLAPLEQSRRVFEAIAEIRLPVEIWAYARLDLVSYQPWIADLMNRANFRFIQFGMESGDRGVLRAMSKNYDPGRWPWGRGCCGSATSRCTPP